MYGSRRWRVAWMPYIDLSPSEWRRLDPLPTAWRRPDPLPTAWRRRLFDPGLWPTVGPGLWPTVGILILLIAGALISHLHPPPVRAFFQGLFEAVLLPQEALLTTMEQIDPSQQPSTYSVAAVAQRVGTDKVTPEPGQSPDVAIRANVRAEAPAQPAQTA